ncbi:MAG TPA: TMEM175 family protein [Candidatus Nitrosocosmicus sp.]|nr:TMEM175 family protein [Candidatus Nitrosocosmicus sp.]
MKGFLSVERLEGLSDSVLLVALTILAYNLIPPTLVNGQADPTEVASFFDNLYGMVSSFFVIFIFWVLYMKILDHLTVPDDVVILTSLIFFILILVTPVFTLSQVQYESASAVVFLSILMIITDLILIFLWKYIHKKSLSIDHGQREVKSIHNIFLVIPTLYTLSILLTFYSIKLAIILPVIMIPTLLLMNIIFHKNDD